MIATILALLLAPAWHTETQTVRETGATFTYDVARLDKLVAVVELIDADDEPPFYAWEVSCRGAIFTAGEEPTSRAAHARAADAITGVECK